MKSTLLHTIILIFCGFAIIRPSEQAIKGGGPRNPSGPRAPKTFANITIVNKKDEIIRVADVFIPENGVPVEADFEYLRVDVKRATVESNKETVKCFFVHWTHEDRVPEEDGRLFSSYFSPTEELTELFYAAVYLYCYDSAVYANTPVGEGDAAAAAAAATGATTTAALFALYLDSADTTRFVHEPFKQVRVPEGQVHGSIDLFSGMSYLNYIKRAAIIDASSDRNIALEPSSAAPDDNDDDYGSPPPPSSRNDSSVGKAAVCYIELYPSGIRQLSLGAEITFDEREVMRGVTCFRAGHTQEDFERVRSTRKRWVE